MRSSPQPGPSGPWSALSRIRACIKTRAGAAPAAINSKSWPRSVAVSVTANCFFIPPSLPPARPIPQITSNALLDDADERQEGWGKLLRKVAGRLFRGQILRRWSLAPARLLARLRRHGGWLLHRGVPGLESSEGLAGRERNDAEQRLDLNSLGEEMLLIQREQIIGSRVCRRGDNWSIFGRDNL